MSAPRECTSALYGRNIEICHYNYCLFDEIKKLDILASVHIYEKKKRYHQPERRIQEIVNAILIFIAIVKLDFR